MYSISGASKLFSAQGPQKAGHGSVSLTDVRTVLGKTMRNIANLCGNNIAVDQLTACIVKKKIRYAQVDQREEWRIGVLRDMMSMKCKDTSSCNLSLDETDEILKYVCSS